MADQEAPGKLLPSEQAGCRTEGGDKAGDTERKERPVWSNKVDFFMTAVSSAIGLGNIWRFPYKCYSNGGGAFLIAFVIMVVLVGLPLVCLDLALGQLGRCGPLEIWKICPAFEGVGWSVFGLDLVANVYYVLLIALGLLYMFHSFRSHLPWASCNNDWNTPECRDLQWVHAVKMCRQDGGVWVNNTCTPLTNTSLTAGATIPLTTNLTWAGAMRPQPPSEEFFHNEVLQLSAGIEDVGNVQLPLMGCVLLSWLLVFIGLSLGVRSLGKISYLTTLLPYTILTALLVQTLREEGAVAGIAYFFNPDWSKLASGHVWTDAAVQAFFSLNCGGGVLITIGSYNKPNNNCVRDGLILTLCDFLTSIFCGMVVFAILGHLAHALGFPISDVVGKGVGLAFIVYPEMLARMPVAPLWASLFMFMIFNLGIGTCMPITANVQTILVDRFPATLSRGRRPLLLLVGLVCTWALLGIALTTQAGMYILQLLDKSVPYILVFTGFCKVVAISWIYGFRRFLRDLGDMVGCVMGNVWFVTCSVTAPVLILVVTVCNLADYRRLSYDDYVFPVWADVLAWCITLTISSAVPATALYRLVSMDGGLSWRKRVQVLITPSPRWSSSYKDSQNKEAALPLNDHVVS